MKSCIVYFLIASVFLLFSEFTFAGQWTRLNSSTIQFEGIIEEKVELQKLLQHWDDNVKKLIVNSPGGHTVTGILMAEFLADKNFDIDVQGQCMSACANYLFLTAKQKVITNGVVGFHGNATAAFYDLSDMMNFREKQDFTMDDFVLMAQFWGENSKRKLLDLYDEYSMAVEIEKELFKNLGVSQQLFDRSQRHDKRMNNQASYSFLLPKPETFAKYGVKNVIGDQNHEILRTWPVFVENAELGFDVVID